MNKSIVWEGFQFGYDPVALLNRQLCLRLIDAGYDLSIIASGRPSFVPETNDRFHELSDRFNKKLEIPPDTRVRHQKDPDFTSPDVGHWVIMQHWEFGSLPKAWVEPMRQMVDEIWVRSSFVRECFIKSGVPDGKVFVIPTGVDTCKFQPGLNLFPLKTKKRFKFLSIGTTLYRKAIEAYCATFTSADDVCLVIKDMGGQSLHKGQTVRKLISDIWEKDDAPEIEYVDQIMDESDLAGLYNACDCLFHLYGGEGFGLPIAEAMACGLPVIITGHGSVLDFCSEDNAYLIPPRLLTLPEKRIGDKETVDFPWLAEPDFEALKGMLRHVIDHPEEAREKGKAGRIQIETSFTWEKIGEAVIRRFHALELKPILRFEKAARAKRDPIKGLVSIIIQVSDDLGALKRCFESTKRHTSESHEIIFVHRVATKKIRQWLKEKSKKNPSYHLIEGQKTENVSKAVNSGIKKSSGEYILLLSDSVVVTKDWLSGMLECLKRGPDAGIVVPMSNFTWGRQKVSTANHISMDLLDEFSEAFRAKNRFRRIASDSIHGSCMLFARDFVEDIGAFDEHQSNYAGEEFCLRANLRDYTNFIAGDVYIHQQRQESSALDREYHSRKWNKEDTQSVSGKKRVALDAIAEAWNVYQRGNIDDAVEILLESLKLSPDYKPTYYCLGDLLINAKQYKDALDVLNEMPQGDRDVKIIEMIGQCKEGMDLDQEALRLADHALSINNNSAVALNLKGLLAFKLGEIEAAEDYFKKAIAADPGYGDSYTNMGAIRWENKPEDALNLFERGFMLSPTTPDILANYHSAIAAAGEFIRAASVFEDACLLYPDCKIIRYRFIDVLLKLEKNQQAIDQIEKALVLYGVDDGILPAALKIRELLGPKEIDKQRKQKNTVSSCMIVKNEEEHLAKCLESVKPVVDEMIVVDTGSTDRTRDLAAVFGAKIYDFKWMDDFSEARNFSLSKASGKWTFHLDADEVISPIDYGAFRKVIQQAATKDAAFLVNTRNYTMNVNLVEWVANDGKYNMEESGTGWKPSEKVRLFRNDQRIRFAYPIHELVDPFLKKAGIKPGRCSVQVHHYGTMNEEKNLDKCAIYYQIGRKKLDEMGEDAIALRELAIQAEILMKHDEAVGLWKRFIAIVPNEPKAYINIGMSYCRLGKFEDVLETAKKAMTFAPDMKEAHYHYALGKLHLGSAAEAVSTLENLLERVGKYPPAKFLLAAAYCCAREGENGIRTLNELQKTSMSQSLPVRCHELAEGLIACGKSEYALLLLDAAINSKSGNKNIIELYAKCIEMTDSY